MASGVLLGPPVSFGKSLSDEPDGDEATVMISPIYQSMNINTEEGKPPMMGLTENLAPTFLATGNPCLDFFFHVVPNTPPHQLIPRLESSWAHDPSTTLKLICNLRGVRGTGKSDKHNFYNAAFWLYKKHPRTLSFNSKSFAHFGYFKDLPEILFLMLQVPHRKKPLKKERINNNRRGKKFTAQWKWKHEDGAEVSEKKKKPFVSREEARVLRKEREACLAIKALDKYKSDPSYRLFYDSVCDVFADVLKLDMEYLKADQVSEISLAAKWCPSIDSSYDKATLICEGIARRVFAREEYENLEEEAHYVYRVRYRLRKEVLVPLHRALQLPEVYMSANEWSSLPYGRVPSVAMKNYKKLFQKHDKERFDEYLEKVRSGEAKIAAGALLPHEVVRSVKSDDEVSEVGELQWRRMVEDVSKKGTLTNCLAICDVSGSMSGIPMEVSVALGILVSELSEEPWKGKVMTFSEHPELHLVEGDTLKAKSEFVESMDWGMNTNFQMVFDIILRVAAEKKLTEGELIKRLFVFSDMEFDSASNVNMSHRGQKMEAVEKGWETDYELIQRKFREHGYSKVPEIVFWNLRNSFATPVVAKQAGVAMVSGFSKNLLTLFLDKGGIMDAEEVMGLALAGEEYTKLVVYD